MNKVADDFKWYYEKGYITSRDGNAAYRNWKDKDSYFVTESGIKKEDMYEDWGTVLVDRNGKNIDKRQGRGDKRMSIEGAAHLQVLNETGKGASVHVHSPNTVALAALFEYPDQRGFGTSDLTKILNNNWPELFRYTNVGYVVPFCDPGSADLHAHIAQSMRIGDICIMQRHGVLAVGEDMEECREHIVRLEHISTILLKIVTASGKLESIF